MQKELNSIEIYYLANELKHLEGSKLSKIYQPQKQEFYFHLHKTGTGKQLLRILLPQAIYLADAKEDMPAPRGICQRLRKQLTNARLTTLEQVNTERILHLQLEHKDATHHLYIELFSTGNLILTDDKKTIITALEQKDRKDRSTKPGTTYTLPPQKTDLRTLTKEQFTTLITTNIKKNIATTLATNLSLGGTYAQELCARANIPPTLDNITPQHADKLYAALASILTQPLHPVTYTHDGTTYAAPFPLHTFNTHPHQTHTTYSDAIAHALTTQTPISPQEQHNKRVTSIINAQEQKKQDYEKLITENTLKADTIYTHYQELQQLLNHIKELKKKHSWKEITELLKTDKRVKHIDEKTKEIILEV